jgi:hypothetical protein
MYPALVPFAGGGSSLTPALAAGTQPFDSTMWDRAIYLTRRTPIAIARIAVAIIRWIEEDDRM